MVPLPADGEIYSPQRPKAEFSGGLVELTRSRGARRVSLETTFKERGETITVSAIVGVASRRMTLSNCGHLRAARFRLAARIH